MQNGRAECRIISIYPNYLLLCLPKSHSFCLSALFIKLECFEQILTYYKIYSKLLITIPVHDLSAIVRYGADGQFHHCFVSHTKYLTRGLRKGMVL